MLCMKKNVFLFILSISFCVCGISQNDVKEQLGQEEAPVPEVIYESSVFISYFVGESIVIPEDASGYLYIVYDSQPNDGGDRCCPSCESDNKNNMISMIPPSGVYRYACDSRVHQEILKRGELQFFKGIYRDKYFSEKQPMNGYQFDEYLSIKAAVEKGEKNIDFKYALDTRVVVPLGFNETHKLAVENLLGHSVIGKVACFHVGTVEAVFGLNE